MMKFDTVQFSAINAAVANLKSAYGETPTVPIGALNKFAAAAGVRIMGVASRNGHRILTINNGLIEIDMGHEPSAVQPTSPTSGAGEIEELVRKAA
jgi:hypothetical protein